MSRRSGARWTERKTRGSLVDCKDCGRRLYSYRLEEHKSGSECFTRRVTVAYQEMGWAPAGCYGPLIARAGLDAELAPTALSWLTLHATPEPWKSRAIRIAAARGVHEGAINNVEVPENQWWAPKAYVAACSLMAKARIKPKERSRCLRLLVADAELRLAFESARALGDVHGVEALVRGLLKRTAVPVTLAEVRSHCTALRDEHGLIIEDAAWASEEEARP